MTSPIEPRTASLYHASRAAAVEPWLAAAIVAAALATYLVIPMVAPRGLALPIAQAALLVVPVTAIALLGVERPRAALGLRGARARWIAAGIALGATLWYVNMHLVALLPVPTREVKTLETLVEAPALVTAIAMFALVPAVCEEVLFRGVLARALGRDMPLALAAALSSVVFAAYHVSVVQALPTLTFGFGLAVIAIRADSVVPTIVAHAVNNTIAIVLSRNELPGVTAALTAHPTLAFAGCALVSALAIGSAARGRA